MLNLPPPDEMKHVALGAVDFHLGWERFLPAELLFEGPGDDALHDLVLQTIDATVALEAAGAIDEELIKGTMADANGAAARAGTAASASEESGSSIARERGGRALRRPATSLRESLLGRVVLSGGSSRIPGLPTRLENELARKVNAESGRAAAGRADHIVVRPSIEGDATTWHGASVLAGTATFAQHWCVHAPSVPMPSGYEDEDDEDEDDDDEEEEDDDEEDDDDDEVEDDDDEDEEDDEDDDEDDAGDAVMVEQGASSQPTDDQTPKIDDMD